MNRKRLETFFESHLFHGIIISLVLFNAIILGFINAEVLHSQSHILLKIDHILVGIFLIELCLKLYSYGGKFFKSGWNNFDFIVILFSIIPNLSGFSIFRALRVLRLLMLIEFMPKTRVIITGAAKAIPGTLNVILLMILLFYITSIMGIHLFHNAPEFQDLGHAMMTMFQVLTGDDWYNVLRGVEKIHPNAWIYFYVFYVVMVFVFLNLFIGVVVNAFQNADSEEANAPSNLDESHKKTQAISKQIQKLEKQIENLSKLLKENIEQKKGLE